MGPFTEYEEVSDRCRMDLIQLLGEAGRQPIRVDTWAPNETAKGCRAVLIDFALFENSYGIAEHAQRVLRTGEFHNWLRKRLAKEVNDELVRAAAKASAAAKELLARLQTNTQEVEGSPPC